MEVHSGVLKASSKYFESSAQFVESQQQQQQQNNDLESKAGDGTSRYTFSVGEITRSDECFQRLVLFFYTHQPEDLGCTVKTALLYVALADFLQVSKIDIFIQVAARALKDAYVPKFPRSPVVSEPLMVRLLEQLVSDIQRAESSKCACEHCLECKKYSERQSQSILQALILPAAWVSYAHMERLSYDVLDLRVHVRRIFKGYVDRIRRERMLEKNLLRLKRGEGPTTMREALQALYASYFYTEE
ncbi:uncharacterized protein EV422DRAFT_565288 [Fimicolochytrium jonesii]|uniref:uncharacterized protein n=1 Tax=Fimicolochytrium jonesii TaxID=1396493 RepID=UPI0022FE7AC6|nr:uncharacterized protein EV422DRAFT_565288 [Fimicolochytrium jonesii]KAI8823349.1 hypothetical protein EV422DRAFT_565288 [Fimicolochytrium jonesii]